MPRLPRGNAICYSGYRRGQSPDGKIYPSVAEVREGILTFVFEAFDEPWKGSSDPLELERHWGLFTVDREPKQVMQSRYRELLRHRQSA
jgi:hypothetical protein